jgi:hypothetical protein
MNAVISGKHGITGQVAQLVEQRTENPCVGGSIPSLPTKNGNFKYRVTHT